MKMMEYGTKERWDSVFLTAISLESEDVKSFLGKFKRALASETDRIVSIRLSRVKEEEEGRAILLAWYAYDNEEAEQILGPSYFVLELIENAVETVARQMGYRTKRKTHSADVSVLASEILRIAESLVAADKKDITRAQLSRLLDGRRFRIRKISFRGLGYGEAYTLKVDGVPGPGGNVITREDYEANKDVLETLKEIKEKYTWKGLPLLT